MNLLEKAISAIAPRAAARRLEARAQIQRLNNVLNVYEAAAVGRRTQHWRAVGTDPNAENAPAIYRLRNVARDLCRNNSYASRAKQLIAHNIVGAGITPSVICQSEDRKKKISALLKQHFESTDIDADGRLNLYGLQELAIKTVVEAGEVIIRRRPRRSSDGYALPFQLQILEPDHLDPWINGKLDNGNYVIQGVEFDVLGHRVAYYLFDQHPGAMYWTTGQWNMRGKRVSADNVCHVFRADRPGQVRGTSWFAPVVLRLRDFADMLDAKLMQQKIAACFSAFITTQEGYAATPSADGSLPIEQLEPGMIERLRDGESVIFGTPPSTNDAAVYSSVTLHEIACGLGVTYEGLTGDLSGVNFSSGRMGWLEFQRNIDAWRWNMFIPQALEPLERWTKEALMMVTMSSAPFELNWTPPQREMIDPTSENQSAKEEIRAGLSSRAEILRRRGLDIEQIDREIASDNKRADKLGLVLDSDARHTNLRGQDQRAPDQLATDQAEKSGEPGKWAEQTPKGGA
jgi:lambda family phage portal protein